MTITTSVPRWRALIALGSLLAAHASRAGAAPFDLAGPVLEVTVTRGAVTLPIGEVPNLAPGDRLAIKADLPASQSAHYLLVAAFLSGSTNPPAESWFTPCKTWAEPCRHAGLAITVPAGAQQTLILLAPETGGDFHTLVGAVRGRPGAFVRTSQDLIQAALDRSRLEAYLATVRALADSDPAKLAATTPLLARSLAIKVDEKCLDRMPALQAPCLMSGGDTLILNDGHSTSIVEALTTGPGADLAMQASYTPQLSYGYYSPYLASVLDIARILDSFHTAQFAYIPALASPHGAELRLTLNSAPSFHNPKSVLVAALPAVEPAQLPPLHAVDPKEIYCAQKTTLVLPVEGAPLVFSTAYAHDMRLRFTGSNGAMLDLAAQADAARGGFVVDTHELGTAQLGESVTATLHGAWGFDPYDGPTFRLINARASSWQLAPGGALIVGHQDTIHLRAESVSCIDTIMLRDPGGKELKIDWKKLKPDEVELKLPLENAPPGQATLLVRQYGAEQPVAVPVQTFAEAGRFDGFTLHAGDAQGTLKGSHLEEVDGLALRNLIFKAGDLASHPSGDELALVAVDPAAAAALKPERALEARVTLKDGRVLPVTANIEAPRPRVVLLNKSLRLPDALRASNITLADPGELPQGAVLEFALRSPAPASFTHDETVEVATVDESYNTILGLANGGLALENAHVAVATLEPAKAFGTAAFGPLKFRIDAKGVSSEWQPLANLVRLPQLKALECPPSSDLACKLSGDNLYLIDSVAGDEQFTDAVQVPDGFLGVALPVPHPRSGLYIKLRDDPAVANPVTLAVAQLPAAPPDTDRTEVRESALHAEKSQAATP